MAEGAERNLAAIMFTAIQTALVEQNASAASERRIHVRIGLHLGDGITEDLRRWGWSELTFRT